MADFPIPSGSMGGYAGGPAATTPVNPGNSAFGNWFANDGWKNLIVPGWSALDAMFDPTGKNAAQAQAQSQLALNQQAQAYNSAEAEKQRRWEENMSNTAYQRSVEDLRKAGLNPWLAVQGGAQGATTPSGSSASSSSGTASKADNKLAIAAGIFATALRIFLTKH